MNSSFVLDRFEAKLKLVCGWDADDAEPGLRFETGPELTEAALLSIEHEYGIRLPNEYRDFLKRFGDGDIGPGNEFVPLSKGVSANARRPFPLESPFQGNLPPEANKLSETDRWEAYGLWLKEWQSIPKDHGALRICEYGCNIVAVLILNGSYSGKVWTYSGDSAYFGPFGALLDGLHNQSADLNISSNPKDFTFFEWYAHWLDSEVGEAAFDNE